ncbi:MAG TPA: hypothetical protein VF994_07160 [Myxococcales bacterium]
MRRAALVFLLLCSAGARAATNDLQLFRLGSPDNITVCTICLGADNVVVPGDPSAQFRFARMTATLALAFAPAFEDQAQTTGQAGFEVGAGTKVAFPRLSEQEWPSQGTLGTGAPPQMLFLPTITVRKGLGGSVELGAAVSLLAGSQTVGLSGQVRWAALEGLYGLPDVALRAWASHLIGAQELNLSFGGADILVSKSFGVAGSVRLQPYAQYGITLVDASTGAIDFNPGAEDPANPSADDRSFHRIAFWENRYHRFAAGVRMVAGSVLFGLEGGMAFGTNPVQHDGSSGTISTQFTRVWTASARLGLAF